MKSNYQKLIITCLLISSFIFLCGVVSCMPPSGRFVDNGDGTVTDILTDLIWLKNANCYGYQTWYNATTMVDKLNDGECGLTDGSAEGDWRNPTVEEFQRIGTDPPIVFSYYPEDGIWSMPGAPFVAVQTFYYWSRAEYNETKAWYVSMYNGRSVYRLKEYSHYVWPVRSDN